MFLNRQNNTSLIEYNVMLARQAANKKKLKLQFNRLGFAEPYWLLNLAARLAINVATAPAATPESMLTTAKPREHD